MTRISKKASPAQRAAAARVGAVRRAEAALARLVPVEAEREAFADAVDRYANAVHAAALFRAEWEDLGSPSLEMGSMRQPIPHPLVKMVAEHEALAARFAQAVGLDPSVRGRKQVGRPQGAVSAPDRKGVMAAPKLTRVK